MNPPDQTFFCPCPRGLEDVLSQELASLGASDITPRDSGVGFTGNYLLAMRVNLESRLASRVLWQVAKGPYHSEQDLYDQAARLPWSDWFCVERTLKVDTRAHHSPLRSLDFATLRIKDAICDHFRAQQGQRPSIDTHQPEIRVYLFLDATHFTLSLDTSGDALFKRGTRPEGGDAPLKRNLAAGLLALAQWQPGLPLLDAFCGAGTILLEAAEQSLQRAPGLNRSFAFERLRSWPVAQHWPTLLEEAQARILPPTALPLWGQDLKGDALELTRLNLAAAGLEGCVTLKQVNVLESSPPCPIGLLLSNLPYGVRLGEQAELSLFYPALGNTLKQRYAGWTACLFSADLTLPKSLRLKVTRRTPLYNGALECRLFRIPLVQGSNRT
ncbi:MAG: class I SAM-dependent RNA methyltransferase [Ferrovum sp.]|nr:class I SAM-dependent RNA methyltransferase [Ferrovum sp.]